MLVFYLEIVVVVYAFKCASEKLLCISTMPIMDAQLPITNMYLSSKGCTEKSPSGKMPIG